MGMVSGQLRGLTGVAAHIAFTMFNRSHFNGSSVSGMYGHYRYDTTTTDYTDHHFHRCLKLLTKYAIVERLGLSLNDLREYDTAELDEIEIYLEEDRKHQKRIMDELKNQGASNDRNQKRTNHALRKRVPTGRTTH